MATAREIDNSKEDRAYKFKASVSTTNLGFRPCIIRCLASSTDPVGQNEHISLYLQMYDA